MPRPAPTSDSLTSEAIASAAVAILDAEGPDALSFRRLGLALGTSHTTVHRHCGNFDGLLDLCVDFIATQLPDVDPQLPWEESTQQRFIALYRLLNCHPALVALRRDRPWLGEQVLRRLVEPALQSNLAVGMTPEHSLRTYRQMYLFTLGCSVFVDHSDPSQAARRVRTALAGLDRDQFPALTHDVELIAREVNDDAVFCDGLRNLIRAARTDSSATG